MKLMIDMSLTWLHHGHVNRIQKAAREHYPARIIIGLTSDFHIEKHKGYQPELGFSARAVIAEAIKGVDQVVEVPWIITDEILDLHGCDKLITCEGHENLTSPERTIVESRTAGVSSTGLKNRACENRISQANQKIMLTPGPASVHHLAYHAIQPLFGRNDQDYEKIREYVESELLRISGQDKIVTMQGSASMALELGIKSFVAGNVVVIRTGYYGDRLARMVRNNPNVKSMRVVEADENFSMIDIDWIVCPYVETSNATKINIEPLRALKDLQKFNKVKIFIDATGSIGLEEDHGFADVMAFSSCKGLFGLTGASFIAFKNDLINLLPRDRSFYMDLETHRDGMVTGPYHAMASLNYSLTDHWRLAERVRRDKRIFMEHFKYELTHDQNCQPNLCTMVDCNLHYEDLNYNVVSYQPRTDYEHSSVVCHLGMIDKSDEFVHEFYDKLAKASVMRC